MTYDPSENFYDWQLQYLYILLDAIRIRLRNGEDFDTIIKTYPNMSEDMLSAVKVKLRQRGDIPDDNN